jgi:hypothetical protein
MTEKQGNVPSSRHPCTHVAYQNPVSPAVSVRTILDTRATALQQNAPHEPKKLARGNSLPSGLIDASRAQARPMTARLGPRTDWVPRHSYSRLPDEVSDSLKALRDITSGPGPATIQSQARSISEPLEQARIPVGARAGMPLLARSNSELIGGAKIARPMTSRPGPRTDWAERYLPHAGTNQRPAVVEPSSQEPSSSSAGPKIVNMSQIGARHSQSFTLGTKPSPPALPKEGAAKHSQSARLVKTVEAIHDAVKSKKAAGPPKPPSTLPSTMRSLKHGLFRRQTVGDIFREAAQETRSMEQRIREKEALIEDTFRKEVENAEDAPKALTSEGNLMLAAASAAAAKIGEIRMTRTRSRSSSPARSAVVERVPSSGSRTSHESGVELTRSSGFGRTPSHDDTDLDNRAKLDEIAQRDADYRAQRRNIRKALRAFRPSDEDWYPYPLPLLIMTNQGLDEQGLLLHTVLQLKSFLFILHNGQAIHQIFRSPRERRCQRRTSK